MMLPESHSKCASWSLPLARVQDVTACKTMSEFSCTSTINATLSCKYDKLEKQYENSRSFFYASNFASVGQFSLYKFLRACKCRCSVGPSRPFVHPCVCIFAPSWTKFGRMTPWSRDPTEFIIFITRWLSYNATGSVNPVPYFVDYHQVGSRFGENAEDWNNSVGNYCKGLIMHISPLMHAACSALLSIFHVFSFNAD